MQEISVIFYIAVIIMSVVIHEVSHGFAAKWMGDDTAERAGRLTLNPLKHLDPVGSVLVPLVLVLSKAGFVFGWARPVPYNELNLRNRKWGTIAVASAGIISNLSLAIIFGLLMRLAASLGFGSEPFFAITGIIVLINIVLGLFNLIPIPPLDGSRILFSILPTHFRSAQMFLERYAIIVLLVFIFFFWQYLAPIIFGLFKFLTGVSF